MKSIVKTYIGEAIEVEKAGLKVKLKTHSDYTIPEELQRKLDAMPSLKTAFEALTPGRQRAYMFYVSAPNRPGHGSHGLKSACRGFLMARD